MNHELTARQWQSIARENAMALLRCNEELQVIKDERDACRECARRLLANVSHVARAEYIKLYPEIDG